MDARGACLVVLRVEEADERDERPEREADGQRRREEERGDERRHVVRVQAVRRRGLPARPATPKARPRQCVGQWSAASAEGGPSALWEGVAGAERFRTGCRKTRSQTGGRRSHRWPESAGARYGATGRTHSRNPMEALRMTAGPNFWLNKAYLQGPGGVRSEVCARACVRTHAVRAQAGAAAAGAASQAASNHSTLSVPVDHQVEGRHDCELQHRVERDEGKGRHRACTVAQRVRAAQRRARCSSAEGPADDDRCPCSTP